MNCLAEKSDLVVLNLAGYTYNREFQRFCERGISLREAARQALGRKYDLLLEDYRKKSTEWEKQSIFAILLTDELYPALLKEIQNPPFVLYVQGDSSIFNNESISLVGTRSPSAAGIRFTSTLSTALSGFDLTVTSGMAHGLDFVSHTNALNNEGTSIAVLPHGVGVSSPRLRELSDWVDRGRLLLVSEYEPGRKVQKYHFPARNRIIAGLSRVTIFLEGSLKSGAMLTVNHALNFGREVMALDHELLRPVNTGGEKLVQDGARNIADYMDVHIESGNDFSAMLNKENSIYIGAGEWIRIFPPSKIFFDKINLSFSYNHE